MQPPLVVVGAGGHAKVVIATARAAGYRELRVVDHDKSLWGHALLGVTIEGGVDDVLASEDILAVLAIGNNTTRMLIGASARCEFASVVHPSAIVDTSVDIGTGSVVFAGAVIQPVTRLGAHAIVNTSASIDHDCSLGVAVHIAPGARLAGNVTIGDGTLIGIGAVVIPGITIGLRSIVGAGAAVVNDVPNDVTVAGVPARSLR